MVSTLSSFQTQMTSILETLMKSAIMEISKLVDIESNVLLLELRHSRREISELKEKLKLMESQRQEDVRTKTGKNRETADDLYRDIPTHGLTARGQVECKPSMDSPRYCEIHQPNKMIKTERCDAEITRWDNGEDGTQRVQRGKEKPVIIKNAVEKVNQGSQEMETTGVRPPTSESLQPTEKMMVNQAACASSSTCASHTDKSSTNPSPSANASKSMRTCSDPVIQAKRFVCGFCSKRFRCFSRLEVHQRSHTGEKPYRCTLCGKMYAQKGHLYTHQRTHTGEKPYRCALCGKGFIQKCTLDMHLRSHTGEKPFTCTICGKGFTKKCNLNKHLSYQSCIS